MITLPAALAGGIEGEAARVGPRRLARLAEDLSRRYREGGPPRSFRGDDDAAAYAAQRLPATYAAIRGALAMVPLRAGSFAPRTLLDVGAGPGTGAWAACDVWPGLASATCVERDEVMVALGRRLASAATAAAVSGSAATAAAVSGAEWLRLDVADGRLPRGPFDLVLLAHVLSEVPPTARRRALVAAFAAASGVLVVVEPGTPAGFAVVREARSDLVRLGARTLAPCPHDLPCPLLEGDWCHFPERLARPAVQRRVKAGSLPHEDAKFSFAAVARFDSVAPPFARVVRKPRRGRGHVDLDLCTRAGLERRTVARSAGDAWRLAKDLEWGSALEP